MAIGPPLGIAILVLGLVLLGLGYQASQAPLEQISNTLTGRFTDRTTWYIIGGIVAAASGAFMTIFGRRS
jgi:hypothetical protein